MNLKLFGSKYGGFYYPEDLKHLNSKSIIYCIGAGEDISHDIEIAHKLNSIVYIFDPTPRSIGHVNYIKDLFNGTVEAIESKRYGGGDLNYINKILNYKIESTNIKFSSYGVHTKNDTLKFYKPTNDEYVSHSLVEGMKSDKFIYVDVKDLPTIMKENNHTNIDLLKIDIEGSECDVIDHMIQNNIFPTYLSVDFDLGYHGEKIKDIQRVNDTIDKLKKYNYSILHNYGSDYSFLLETK